MIKVIFNGEVKKINANDGDNLLKVLASEGYLINADCGGRGVCGKCKVKLVSGNVNGAVPDKEGNILSCKAVINGDLEVKLLSTFSDTSKKNKDELKVNKEHLFGIAFDLGTTTLAFSLVDITDKKVLDTFTELNKQAVFGADVISRISASNEGNLNRLNEIILSQLENAVKYFSTKNDIVIDKVVVSANTTMLHLLLNESPKSLGYAPFTPVFTCRKSVLGSKLGVSVREVEVLPSCSAFVGADITSGVYALNLQDNEMLVDLGTNGEIIYKTDGKYYSTSTAAGPCLEGACIDCGLGGIRGAISKVTEKDGTLKISTIANEKPIGICGAGLVDTIACLLDKGVIDYTGNMEVENGKFNLTDDVYLSVEDVRKFQLAKSAICSGIKSLLIETNKDINDIQKFYLAGGIGYYINIDNAIRTGILPKETKGKVYVAGNSSLKGAEKALTESEALSSMDKIASLTTNIDLNSSESFNEGYIMNMFFE